MASSEMHSLSCVTRLYIATTLAVQALLHCAVGDAELQQPQADD